MKHSSREQLLWTLGLSVVVLYALLPVCWLISLSLKTPDTVADKRLIPKSVSLENYTALLRGRPRQPRCCGR